MPLHHTEILDGERYPFYRMAGQFFNEVPILSVKAILFMVTLITNRFIISPLSFFPKQERIREHLSRYLETRVFFTEKKLVFPVFLGFWSMYIFDLDHTNKKLRIFAYHASRTNKSMVKSQSLSEEITSFMEKYIQYDTTVKILNNLPAFEIDDSRGAHVAIYSIKYVEGGLPRPAHKFLSILEYERRKLVDFELNYIGYPTLLMDKKPEIVELVDSEPELVDLVSSDSDGTVDVSGDSDQDSDQETENLSDIGSDNEKAKKDSIYSDISSADEAEFTNSQENTKSSTSSDSPGTNAKASEQEPSDSEFTTSDSAVPGSESSDSNSKDVQRDKKSGTQTHDDLSPPPPPVFEIHCSRCKFFFNRRRSLKSSRKRFMKHKSKQ